MDPSSPRQLCERGNNLVKSTVRVWFLVFALLAQSLAVEAASGPIPLQLEVFVNGQPTKLIGTFSQLADGRISAWPSELEELGLKPPKGAQGQPVVLDDMAGLAYVYEQTTQAIYISTSDENRRPNDFDASGKPARGSQPVQFGTGAILNYTAFASASTGATSVPVLRNTPLQNFEGVSLTLDKTFFSTWGTVSSSAIVRQFEADAENLLRLDTTWAYSDLDRMVTYRAGDLISGGLPWTRPIRLGGVQIKRDFKVRPDLVTMPLPSFSGSAVVPSTVDVFVNNNKVFSQDVGSGPFNIANVPVVTGAGDTRMVIRDASGRESQTVSPFFASTQLLKEGLNDFSIEAGLARRDYATSSFAYDDQIVVSASGRYGWSNDLTIEGHVEGGAGLGNGGLGVTARVGTLGRVSGAVSGSVDGRKTGGQVYAAVETQVRKIDIRASSQRAFGGYSDLGAATADGQTHTLTPGLSVGVGLDAKPPKAVDQLSVAVPLGFDPSTLSATVVHLEPSGHEKQTWLAAASWSRVFGRDTTLYATAFHDLAQRSTGVFAGFSMALGVNRSVSVNVGRDANGTAVGATYSEQKAGGLEQLNWGAATSQGSRQATSAYADWRGEKADISGRVAQADGGWQVSTSISGSVIAMREGVFLANHVNDAFAVVDVGVPDVDVLYENRRVTRTDASGKALVTGLRSYETNLIAVDPLNLPLHVDVGQASREVVPAYRNGVAVKFNIESRMAAALVVFRDSNGKVIPAGARGQLSHQPAEFVVGYDGQAYLTDLNPANTAVIQTADKTCTATFPFNPATETQVRIDPVICK